MAGVRNKDFRKPAIGFTSGTSLLLFVLFVLLSLVVVLLLPPSSILLTLSHLVPLSPCYSHPLSDTRYLNLGCTVLLWLIDCVFALLGGVVVGCGRVAVCAIVECRSVQPPPEPPPEQQWYESTFWTLNRG
jgi:hypothetical protein